MRSLENTWPLYKRLLSYTKPYRTRLAGGILFSALYGLPNAAGMLVVRDVWARVFEQTDRTLDFWQQIAIASMFPLIMLLRGVCDFSGNYLMNWVGARVVMDLRVKLFEHLQKLSLDFYSDARSGEIISRLTNDVNLVHQAVATVVEDNVKQPFALIAAVGALLYIDWKLTAAALALFPLCIVPIAVYGRKIRKASQNTQQHLGSLLSVLQEAIAGARVVKAFRMEEREASDFRELCRRVFSQYMRVSRSHAILGPMIELLAALGVALMFVYAYQTRMASSELVSIALGLFLMYEPVKKLSRVHLNIQVSVSGAERIFHLLDEKPTVVEAPSARDLRPLQKSIRLERVSFRYNTTDEAQDRGVLDGVDLEIPAGHLIAIVGPSGAGKTTLMNLVLRFYDPVAGAIKIDGTDVREVTFKSLRDQIGLVTQETFLFNDTVRDNIAYGKPETTTEEMIHAAKRAHAHEFIEKMPQGYDTIIGEAGVKLSGGQRQRLAIARAILKNPPILLLDEATSALDTESERAVQAALDDLMWGEKHQQKHTMLVIAHRLSTVQHADRIVVLEKGRIVEEGTHQELLAKGQLYKRLYDLQFSV